MTPSDWNSQGRVPELVSNREMGQHYYEVLETSGSSSEASYSGTPGPYFCTYGVFCSLFVSDLEKTRRKYVIPDDFTLVVPSDSTYLCQSLLSMRMP